MIIPEVIPTEYPAEVLEAVRVPAEDANKVDAIILTGAEEGETVHATKEDPGFFARFWHLLE